MPSRVTKKTLRDMIDEFGLIPMSEDELDLVIPQVQSLACEMDRTKNIDVSDTGSSHVFRASLDSVVHPS